MSTIHQDTICAVSTAPGTGGVAIIRVSGPDAIQSVHAMKLSYKQQFGVEPAVKVIHAGLECGIIGANCPGLDMISFGPTLRSPHSPDERALIPTVSKFYDFLVATLEQTPEK
jgi:di/tripeptidase